MTLSVENMWGRNEYNDAVWVLRAGKKTLLTGITLVRKLLLQKTWQDKTEGCKITRPDTKWRELPFWKQRKAQMRRLNEQTLNKKESNIIAIANHQTAKRRKPEWRIYRTTTIKSSNSGCKLMLFNKELGDIWTKFSNDITGWMDFVKEKDLAIYLLQKTDLASKNIDRKGRKPYPKQMKL